LISTMAADAFLKLSCPYRTSRGPGARSHC
jgi:hypothetical protein